MKEGWLNRQLSKTAESTKVLPAWKQELRTLDKRSIVKQPVETTSSSGRLKTQTDTEAKPAQTE